MTKLTVDLRIGETLTIGNTTVRLEKKSGQLARLVVTADEITLIKIPNTQLEPTNEARMSALRPTGAHHGKHPV